MPWFVCQNEECGHRFFDRSQLAALSPCPMCDEGELEPEYDEPTPPPVPAPTARERALDARSEARQFLRKHKVAEIPVDVQGLAQAEGLIVERRSLGDENGHLVGQRLTVNIDQALVRQRFTIAHELAHSVMHTEHGTNEYSERQAEVFAGALLIPRDTLRREFAAERNPEALARRFFVSRAAMWIELQDARLVAKLG